MKKGIRNFFNIIWKQGARQMLMAAVIFFAVISALPRIAEGSAADICVVTDNNDAGPDSLRQCVLNAESGSVITFSDDHIITLDSKIIIEKDLTVDAEGFAVTLQADAMPGVAGHGLLTVSEDAAVTVRNMTLRHGRGTMSSAAIQSDGTLTLEDCVVTENHALHGYDSPGIANTGTLTLVRSVLSDHADGRALIMNIGPSAVLTVRDSTFRDNGIPGIRNSGGGSVSLSGCTFVSNHTSAYGCVWMDTGGGTLTADNCTFTGNSTSHEYGGAALYLANSGNPAAVLTNCTVTGNTASGTYGRSAIARYSGTVTVTNSIVAGTCHSTVTGTYSYFDPAKSGTGNLSPADGDPGVGMPADNGGPALTCALSPESVCIDAGTGVALSQDQRGFPRDSGNGVDMGAFEVQAGPDTDPPTVPGNLTAAGAEFPMSQSFRVELLWDASSDSTGVAHYEILRDGYSVSTVTGTAYTDDVPIFFIPMTLTYTVTAYDAAGNCSGESEPVSVTLTGLNTAPSVTVTEPAGQDSAEDGIPYHIRWTDSDPDDNAQVSLYYDTDSAGNDGILIVSGLEEDDETDEHAWDTAGVPAGEYYVYAVISDGTNDPVTAHSSGTVTVTEGSEVSVTEVRVGGSSDDAEEYGGGTIYITSTDLELVRDDGRNKGNQTVGIRFDGVAVPQGAVITAAYLEFETDETDTEPTSVMITAGASDDAATFTAASGDISGRITVGSSVAWNDIPQWDITDEKHRTPDISPPVQEIVSRGGWASGNAMAFIITGSGRRTAESYDGDPSAAPLLHIEFTADGEDTVPPSVPQNLTAEVIPVIWGYQVSLSWDASSDNIAVAGYDVFCGDIGLTGTPADTSYIHDTESPGDCAYTVEAYDAAGNRSGKSAPVSVTPGNTAPSITVSAEPGTENHTFIIRWSDDDPDDSAQISLYYDTDSAGNDGVLIVSGLEEDDETDEHVWDTVGVPAGEYYVYAIIDDSANDPVTAYSTGTVTVTVPAPEIVTFTAEPQTVTAGETATLTWEVASADTVSIDQGIGTVGLTGSTTVQPAETVTYTLTAEGPGGTVSAQAAVTANIPSGPVTLTASPETVQKGGSFTLSWTFSDVQSAYINKGVGTENGSRNVSPDHTETYTITVSGDDGPVTAEATVTVTGNPAPQPEGSFGRQYEDLIPPDAVVDSYEPERFSVITGLVHDINGDPLPDVDVTVHAHPEYGTVHTDAQGRFSIPVEGGAAMKVIFRKAGLIFAQRQVHVPWNDVAVTETLRLIPEDTAATTVTFDGNPDTVITHQSTPVTDEFGTRSATLVFQGDNQAYLTDENGNDVREVTTITARATEYATPESMPAKLPPTSAYTYCTELSADGMERVRFQKPVAVWVDNFLGFEVGEAVPSGYYDRDRGVWVPSENGRVVRLLDTDSDGVTDAVDADGDGNPDDLDGDGSLSDEVTGLDDPQRYAPNAEFWRVEVTHFTPWDFNWCSFFSLLDMLTHGPPAADEQCDDCEVEEGSYVEARSRIFHEDIPVPGTDLTLHYASNRAEGYKSVITVPASGTSVPDSVKRILVRVEVAGRTLEQTLDPLPDQKAEFVWDGLDFLGNPVNETVTARIGIGFVYDSFYLKSGYLAMSFGMFGTEITEVPTRDEVISWQRSEMEINRSPGKADTVADGWTLSEHHLINLRDTSVLYRGDGSFSKNSVSIITTVAGNGENGYWGTDGSLATEDYVVYPSGVTSDAEGNFYIASGTGIRKVDRDGIITTIAGGPDADSTEDGIPAEDARIRYPRSIAFDRSGNLYISEGGLDGDGHYRVRKIDTDGIITTVAGNGLPAKTDEPGDGRPATEVSITPIGVAPDAFGNIYIGESRFVNSSGENTDDPVFRVRKVDTNGIITTVAGTGEKGVGSSGIPATESALSKSGSITLDASGNLYISDLGRIRKVGSDGIISTVAGLYSYTGDNKGDGGPALEAELSIAYSVAFDTEGNFYIPHIYGGNRTDCIRKVDTGGIISTVAGIGTIGYSGDSGPAVLAEFNNPRNLAVGPDGDLYIPDYYNHRVRKVTLGPASFSGEFTFADGNGLGYVISDAGRHTQTTDLNTGVVLREFGYDGAGRLVSITDPRSETPRVTTIERDGNGVPTAIISPDGLRTDLTVDSDNQLTHVTWPGSSSPFVLEYENNDGLLTEKTEPEGNVFTHVFDATGRVEYTTDQEGGRWEFTRVADADGAIVYETKVHVGDDVYNVTSYTDHTDSTSAYTSDITGPTGALTEFGRSADGLSATKKLPCGSDLAFEYDTDPRWQTKLVKKMTETAPSGLTKVVERGKSYEDTDSDGFPDVITETVTVNDAETTTFVHDIALAKKTVTSPEGRSVVTEYNPATLLTSKVSVPGLHDTVYGYDTEGRPETVTTGTRQSVFAYNSRGNIASVTDPEENVVTYDYDDIGRVTAVHRPDITDTGNETVIAFDYDENGSMTVLTNPSAVDHGFGFNKVNLNSSYTTPMSGDYSYVYDKARRLTRKDFPSGAWIRYNYDPAKLGSIETSEGDAVSFAYSSCGTKVESVSRDEEQISYGYDGSLVTSETLTGTLARTLSYTYNSDFAVQNFTYAGETRTYGYDNDGLLTGAGDLTVTRNAGNGLPKSVTGGSLSLTRGFNGYGETENESFSAGGTELFSWSVVRDDNGRITEKTENLSDGTTANYEYDYDAVGRLLTVTRDEAVVESYQYDTRPYGIRTYEERYGVGRLLRYNDEDNLLEAGDTDYQHDEDGFLVSKTEGTQVTTYDYSLRGELLRVDLPDGRVIEYVHDPLGRRIAKKVDNIVVEKYLWQGLTRLLAVYNADDTLRMRFEYADARMPVAMTKDGATYYLGYDQIGTLKAVADASGSVIKRIEYDAFGNILDETNPLFAVPFGFAGGLHDRDTGLVRFGYRDYDPETGRWTAKDPILFAGGDTDLYGYCVNDPVNWTDNIGLMVLPPDPSGLPWCWETDPSHGDPNGLRLRHPSGAVLDFHFGRPGLPGYRGIDHWHYNMGDDHLLGGDEIPDGECPEDETARRTFLERLVDVLRRINDFMQRNVRPRGPTPLPLPLPMPGPIPIPIP